MSFNHCYYIQGQTHIIDVATEDGTTSLGKTQSELTDRYPDAQFMLWDEAWQQIQAINKAKYLDTVPVEITEENFDEMLNVLPPQCWHCGDTTESFFLLEAQTENIHPVYARVFNRYFKLYATRGTKHQAIIERIMRTAYQVSES